MRPLLEIHRDGEEHQNRDLVNTLAAQFSLTDDERRQMLPSERAKLFDNRVGWAKWIKCQETNRTLGRYRYPDNDVVFLNLQDHFIEADGSLKSALYVDGTHLSPRGYKTLAVELQPMIERLIKLGPVAPLTLKD